VTAQPVDLEPPEGRFDDADEAPVWASLLRPVPRDWYESPPAARSWLLRDGRRPRGDGLLPLGKVGQLIAEGGAGKTMALAQLAVAVATATPWLGCFTIATPAPGRVLFIVGEEDEEETHRRLYRARRAMDAPVPDAGAIVVLPLAGVPCAMLTKDDHGNLAETAFLAWLRAWVAANGPWSLIIVDPLSRFAGPDAEKDNAAGTRFIQCLESIATLTAATVLVSHHTNKLSRGKGAIEGTAGRGSSSFFDGARWECSLGTERLELGDADTRERLGEIVTWTNTKTNYSRKAEPVLLRRDLDNGGALVPLDDADEAMVRDARGLTAAQAQKDERKAAERSARESAEDAAVVQAVTDRPGIPLRDLVKRVQALLHCGADRAEVAVARADLDVREGPRRARLHYLRPSPTTPSNGAHA
jgi:RecA-family ATPase